MAYHDELRDSGLVRDDLRALRELEKEIELGNENEDEDDLYVVEAIEVDGVVTAIGDKDEIDEDEDEDDLEIEETYTEDDFRSIPPLIFDQFGPVVPEAHSFIQTEDELTWISASQITGICYQLDGIDVLYPGCGTPARIIGRIDRFSAIKLMSDIRRRLSAGLSVTQEWVNAWCDRNDAPREMNERELYMEDER